LAVSASTAFPIAVCWTSRSNRLTRNWRLASSTPHIENFKEDNFHAGRYQAIAQASSVAFRPARRFETQSTALGRRAPSSTSARIKFGRLTTSRISPTQRLSDINKELTDAQSERIRSARRCNEFAKSGNCRFRSGTRSVGYSSAGFVSRNAYDLNSQASDALAQYGPNFPKVQRLQGQLKEIDQLILDEKKSIVDEIGQRLQRSPPARNAADAWPSINKKSKRTRCPSASSNTTFSSANAEGQQNSLRRHADQC